MRVCTLKRTVRGKMDGLYAVYSVQNWGKNIGCGRICVFDCLRLLNESSRRWSVRDGVREKEENR